MAQQDEPHRDAPVSAPSESNLGNTTAEAAANATPADGAEAMSQNEAAPGSDGSAGSEDKSLKADADFRAALKDLREFVNNEDGIKSGQSRKITFAGILGGDILASPWFRKQIFYIIMLLAMAIVYISNRYSCQQKMIEQKMLTDTLLDRRYKALTRSAQLKERMRRSYIEEALDDSTLQTAVTPSYNLKVEEE